MTEDVSITLQMAEESMQKAINHLEAELVKIRAGKANPTMLDGIVVDYYGLQRRLRKLGTSVRLMPAH